MLIGTTMTSFARDITTMLQSQNVQVSMNVSQAFRVAFTTLNASRVVKASVSSEAKSIWYDQSLLSQAHAYALLYEPQPTAAVIVPFYPLAPLASKAEGWEISFVVSHSYQRS